MLIFLNIISVRVSFAKRILVSLVRVIGVADINSSRASLLRNVILAAQEVTSIPHQPPLQGRGANGGSGGKAPEGPAPPGARQRKWIYGLGAQKAPMPHEFWGSPFGCPQNE